MRTCNSDDFDQSPNVRGAINPKRLVVFLALLVTALSPCFVQAENSDKEASVAAGSDATQPIRITAQRLVADNAGNTAEFIGDVRAHQGDTVIVADSLKLFFGGQSGADENKKEQSLEKLVATGNVEIKFDNRLAVARQAVYITAERVLILKGPEATVTSGDNTFSGETITFYRAEGRLDVDGGSDGRVKAVILPDEQGIKDE